MLKRKDRTKKRIMDGCRGFSLVELLIAVAIFGIVATGVMSAYLSMQKTTYNEMDITDVQQQLRVTMNLFDKDIKMAGLLIPDGITPVATGSNGSRLNLVTASTRYQFARLGSRREIPGGAPTTDFVFSIASPEETDWFAAGDTVRLIRPMNGVQPVNTDLAVMAVDRDESNGGANPTMTLRGFNSGGSTTYLAGDMIASVTAGGPDPSTISWFLNGDNLVRQSDGGTPAVVAAGISALTFEYLTEDGNEADATDLQDDDLEELAAIRVTLTAEAGKQLDNVTRNRSLASVIKIRN